MKGTVAEIFEIHPEHWGLRGDPYLWEDLKEFFSNIPLPYSVERFKKSFHIFYKLTSGYEIKAGEKFYIPGYDEGGMSGGMIHSSFWLEEGLPLLISRLEEANKIYEKNEF
jgi:hypothetical protein